MIRFRTTSCFLLLACSPVVNAQQALGTSLFSSRDSDGTTVTKTGLTFDYRHVDNSHYRGIRLEQARFAPAGGNARDDQRLYYRFSDSATHWAWSGEIGTDGNTWLGNASIHSDAKPRQEYFFEREVVETPVGLERGIHSTFVGAAYDFPLDSRNILTAVAGVQAFSGDNTRLHLRGRYIRVLKEDWGLSAQLRLRYFHSSRPHEFDYYSPRWHAEAIPVVQLRRFHGGWHYQAAAGWGRQGDTDSGWRNARLLEASVTSPTTAADWMFKASIASSTQPGNTGFQDGYRYRQFTLQASKAF